MDSFLEVPAEILAAPSANESLLPEKNKDRYQNEYDDLLEWCRIRKVKLVNDDVIIAYVKEKSDSYCPSSMWSKISSYHVEISFTSFRKYCVTIPDMVNNSCF